MTALVRDQWLSEATGLACLRLNVDADSITGWVAQAQAATAFAFCKIPVMRIERVKAVAAAGFYVVDTNVTLDWHGAEPDQTVPDGIEVEVARPEDHAQAQRIAGGA